MGQPMLKYNGFELVERLIKKGGGKLDVILAETKMEERDWLEFKSVVVPAQKEWKDGENENTNRWHVAHAVMALANSWGGAVIVGIPDKNESGKKNNKTVENTEKRDVQLEEPIDFAEGINEFITWDRYQSQHLDAAIFPQNREWIKDTNGRVRYSISPERLDSLRRLVTYDAIEFKGKRLVLIKVKPISGDNFIIIDEHANGTDGHAVLYAREKGNRGEDKRISLDPERFKQSR